MNEDVKVPEGTSPEGQDLQKELEVVRAKLNETTKESISRKEKIKELETKTKEFETLINNIKAEKTNEDTKPNPTDAIQNILQLKEKELIESKLELEKIKQEYINTKNEAESKSKTLQEYESKLKEIEETQTKKKTSLLAEIKTLAEARNNNSIIEVAEAITSIDGLEKYYKQLSEKEDIIMHKSKPSLQKNNNVSANSVSELQKLYQSDQTAYKEALRGYLGK